MMETLRVFISDFMDICARNTIHTVIQKFKALIAVSFRTRKFSNLNICFFSRNIPQYAILRSTPLQPL